MPALAHDEGRSGKLRPPRVAERDDRAVGEGPGRDEFLSPLASEVGRGDQLQLGSLDGFLGECFVTALPGRILRRGSAQQEACNNGRKDSHGVSPGR